MEIKTVLLIILAAIVAFTVVFYQYFYKNSKKGSLKILLASFRFIALFSALLLLINPKFTKQDYFLEKANLVLLVDDTESILEGAEQSEIAEKVSRIVTDGKLNERFSVQQYAFGTKLQQVDSFSFESRNTDIETALATTDEIFANSTSAVVLFTDGNQTLGRDYVYTNLSDDLSVYPIIVGDTTAYEDISIGLVNSNTYAFLKNKFPVEATVLYNGTGNISKTLTIAVNGELVHRERLTFSANQNSKTVTELIEAKSIGVKSIKVEIESLDNEKNKFNNSKQTAVEVIDEKTNVAIVSDMLHPDIGTLKKSIETNEQRSVSILKPTVASDRLEDFDLFILYQPNHKFKSVYDFIAKSKSNSFTICGKQTNWGFLNRIQQSFFKENFNQSEEILPLLNNAFSIFGLGDFDVNDFPPLENNLGSIEIKKDGEAILFQKIKGVELDAPLFSIFVEGKQKEAVLFGENIWKWRAQSYRNHQNFENFDDFISKLMVYLNSTNQRSRLELDFPLVFPNSSEARIRASYFDESYGFDSDADIAINVKSSENNFSRESPMLLKGSFFEVDLSDLEAGDYTFTVTVKGDLKRSGSFKILDFNPEKQMIAANYGKLQRLADETNGKVYFPDDIDLLISDLSELEQYTPIQKSKQNVVSLIDFKVLLGLIVLALSLEWFIRKYNGLI
ncbi:VWA domain-containing protein [Flagellimonas sp.]|uniref:VWA domain-containing protein n=1 Tax=Flagellimonas sp. TaxID=2058762 RepID=UPI003B58BE3C